MRGLTVTVQPVAACVLLTAGTAVAQPDGLAHAAPGQGSGHQEIVDDDGGAASTQPQEPFDPGARAEFTWSVPERYAQAWDAWQPHNATYDREYVRPDSWTLMFDACALSGGDNPILAYRFALEGIGFDYRHVRELPTCRYTLTDRTGRYRLEQRGTFRATVTVETALGWSTPPVQEIQPKDWLIVSIGDSLASGECNPDVPGAYPPAVEE